MKFVLGSVGSNMEMPSRGVNGECLTAHQVHCTAPVHCVHQAPQVHCTSALCVPGALQCTVPSSLQSSHIEFVPSSVPSASCAMPHVTRSIFSSAEQLLGSTLQEFSCKVLMPPSSCKMSKALYVEFLEEGSGCNSGGGGPDPATPNFAATSKGKKAGCGQT